MKRLILLCALMVAACGDGDDVPELIKGMVDAGAYDAGPLDARASEAGRRDN